jgi:hypothetical protein
MNALLLPAGPDTSRFLLPPYCPQEMISLRRISQGNPQSVFEENVQGIVKDLSKVDALFVLHAAH